MKKLEIEIPEDLFALLGSEPAARETRVKEALVWDLVRRQVISSGKAAEILNLSAWDLPDKLAEQDIYTVDFTPDDLLPIPE